jgi:hypothetical protein
MHIYKDGLVDCKLGKGIENAVIIYTRDVLMLASVQESLKKKKLSFRKSFSESFRELMKVN